MTAIVCFYPAVAQSLASTDNLPNAPGLATQTTQASAGSQSSSAMQTSQILAAPQGAAQVTGTVLDVQGVPIAGAEVDLSAPGKLGERTTKAGPDGTFAFTDLPPAQYRLIINSDGLDTYTSAPFTVRAGESVTAPPIALKISTTTSVNVVASPEQIAVAQIHEQEKQRVLGVFQNFYTSYIWDAEPMPANQKFKLAFRSLIDPPQFIIVAGIAGAEHYNGTFPGYGPGIEGYGKRYGAALADATTSRLVGSAVLPVLLHQDPRYFYQGSGGFGPRTYHSFESVFITRGDNGKRQPNYSHLLGSLAAGAVSNLYHPETSRGVGNTFQTFGISVGGNIAGNLFREFILRGLVPSVPTYANGKK
jgi:hypothetical protein